MTPQQKQAFFDEVENDIIRLKHFPDTYFEPQAWSDDSMHGVMYPKGKPEDSYEASFGFFNGFVDWEIVCFEEKAKEQPIVVTKCLHPNKKKVNVGPMSGSYMYCPDCKADLGDVK